MADIRTRIWEYGHRNNAPIWVSEIDSQEAFAEKDLDFIRIACLKQVRSVPVLICLLDGSFGTTWDEGQISILEMELVTAAFSQRDIWIFCLSPFDHPDPRILSLLKVIRLCCPEARVRGPLPVDRVLGEIARLLGASNYTSKTISVSSLVADLARKRSPSLNFDLNIRDVQFLGGSFAPLFDCRPAKDSIERLLNDAEKEMVIPDRLARLWIAIRHLSVVPFNDVRNEEYLPQWERALGLWSSASAWYGLHGHFLLGRLASINSLSLIRRRMPARLRRHLGPPSIFADAGAAASEYYSIAKLVPSPWQRRRLLGKALWNCNAALREGAVSDPTGLLDIRGHVKLRMFNPVGAVLDLRRALAIRRRTGQSPARIGESEVHLGTVYAHLRLYKSAEPLLEEGVSKLRTQDRSEFLAQGLRHLAEFRARTGQRHGAMEAIREAEQIAAERESQGQLRQIQKTIRSL